MRAQIVKGRFKAEVTGTMVKITCNDCDSVAEEVKVGNSDSKGAKAQQRITEAKQRLATAGSTLPGKSELEAAGTEIGGIKNKQEQKKFSQAKKIADKEAKAPLPNAMSTMVVAPVTINGRPAGNQPIFCFYCRQVGLLSVEAERPGIGQFGLQPTSLNENWQEHASRRMLVTFVTLLALDHMVRTRRVSPGASIVCAGASLQNQGKSSKGMNNRARQDAHQILRELSIGGTPLYELIRKAPDVSQQVKDVVTYCHGVISHLDAEYNEADCLVERAITVEMIDLGHLILNGSLRQSSGDHDAIFADLLWAYLKARYYYAIKMAIIYAEPGPLRDVLVNYEAIVKNMPASGAPNEAKRGLEYLCNSLAGEVRHV